jgi:hypothetical protein
MRKSHRRRDLRPCLHASFQHPARGTGRALGGAWPVGFPAGDRGTGAGRRPRRPQQAAAGGGVHRPVVGVDPGVGCRPRAPHGDAHLRAHRHARRRGRRGLGRPGHPGGGHRSGRRAPGPRPRRPGHRAERHRPRAVRLRGRRVRQRVVLRRRAAHAPAAPRGAVPRPGAAGLGAVRGRRDGRAPAARRRERGGGAGRPDRGVAHRRLGRPGAARSGPPLAGVRARRVRGTR